MASGLLRVIETIATATPFSYISGVGAPSGKTMTMSCVSSTDAGSRSSLPEPRVRITRTRDSGKPAAAIVSAIARSTVARGGARRPIRSAERSRR